MLTYIGIQAPAGKRQFFHPFDMVFAGTLIVVNIDLGSCELNANPVRTYVIVPDARTAVEVQIMFQAVISEPLVCKRIRNVISLGNMVGARYLFLDDKAASSLGNSACAPTFKERSSGAQGFPSKAEQRQTLCGSVRKGSANPRMGIGLRSTHRHGLAVLAVT